MSRPFLLSALVFLTAIPSFLPAAQQMSFYEVAKLTAADGAAQDQFGKVALSGDTAVVGASQADFRGDDSGAAYVFRRDPGEPDTWVQVAKLTASDGEELDFFGYSVAVSGETAVVGDSYDDDSGSAYVFRRDAGGPEG